MAIYGSCLSLFSGFTATPFLNRKSNINLIIFKTFWSVLARFLKEMQAYVALGVNFYAE
jgi:hypothetical protein